jgi:hypothetical protein
MIFQHEQDHGKPVFIWTDLTSNTAAPSDDPRDVSAIAFELAVALDSRRTWHRKITIKEATSKRPGEILASKEAWWASTLKVLVGPDPKGRTSESGEALISMSFGRHSEADMDTNPPSQIMLQWKDTLGGFPVGFDCFNSG